MARMLPSQNTLYEVPGRLGRSRPSRPARPVGTVPTGRAGRDRRTQRNRLGQPLWLVCDRLGRPTGRGGRAHFRPNLPP